MNQLYFMEINPEINNIVLDEMLLYVSSEKREKLLRYRNEIDRKIGTYAEVLTRCLISLKIDVKFKDIRIDIDSAGKPYLTNSPCCAFNISHTKNAIAVALSDEPVGVDIEKIRDINISIAKSVFSAHELSWLHKIPEAQNLRFFEIWTKKEAFVKHDGRGLSYNLKSFDVTGSFPRVKITTFTEDGYIISLCSSLSSQEIYFVKIKEPELVAMWRRCVD